MNYAKRAIEISSLVAIAILLLIVGSTSWKTEKGNAVLLAQATDTQSPDLEERRAELRMKINNALRSGQLSQTQALEFREQIALNVNEQNQFTKNAPLSFGQAQQLLSDLGSLDSGLQSAIAINSSSSEQGSSTLTTTEVDRMKAYISDRLERARWSGQISRAQYDGLMNNFHQIDNRESALKSARGVISFAAQHHLLSQLNELDARLAQETNNSLAGKSTTFWY